MQTLNWDTASGWCFGRKEAGSSRYCLDAAMKKSQKKEEDFEEDEDN